MPEIGASIGASGTSDRRKLVAVVYADIAGYSRLIGLDDAGTLQRLRALRSLSKASANDLRYIVGGG